MRQHKGQSLLDFHPDYTVIDIETTGIRSNSSSIIEIAAYKYRNYTYVDKFCTLVKPEQPISSFITNLTGITNDMVFNARHIQDVLYDLLDFIDDDILIAHNANFDINFLYDACLLHLNKPLANNFIDTLRLARRLVKDSKNHKLITLAQYFNIEESTHRAEQDVITTQHLYLNLKKIYNAQPDAFKPKKKVKQPIKLERLTPIDQLNKDHYFYNKNVCFSGKMNLFTKKNAEQITLNLGAQINTNVTRNTDVLILGDIDDQIKRFGKKSNKHLKAETMAANGQPIDIITEDVFLDIIKK